MALPPGVTDDPWKNLSKSGRRLYWFVVAAAFLIPFGLLLWRYFG